MYKFVNQDRSYQNFEVVETKTFKVIEFPFLIDATKHKIFSNDTFNVELSTEKITIHHSNFRANKYNAGVLDLGISHGKVKNKLLYLCRPDDKRIPYFLIPYNIPFNFDKSIKKLYITFEFDHWDKDLPYGKLTQNLGSVHNITSFYEYALYTKSLNISLQQFTKDAKRVLSGNKASDIVESIACQYSIKTISKKDAYVFSIDSKNSNDYDDAISYNKKTNTISVYISNVAIILDYLKLWGSFTKRISSIYLPDKKRSMLPNLLTDFLCSLKEKEYKICYCLDIIFDKNGNIINHHIYLGRVYIARNFSHELQNEFIDRHDFIEMCNLMNCKSSRDLITKIMLHTNHYFATLLSTTKHGIFRSLLQQTENDLTDNMNSIPQDVFNHINIIKGQAGTYCLYNEQQYRSCMHQNIDIYLQATSPIRRLVDIINNIVLMKQLTTTQLSKDSESFYELWTSSEKLEYINISTRAIRKIQSKCKIYALYQSNLKNNINKSYQGYIFDKIKKEGDGKYQYMVYIPEINLSSYITLLENLDNYSSHYFDLYVFMNEESDKKKIKLQICYKNKLETK